MPKRDICSRDSFDVTWVLSYKEFWDLESKMAEEWSMKDTIDAAIREVNQDFHFTEDSFIVPEELKSFILGKLPEDFDCEGLNIKGKQTNFRACFVTKDITNDNMVNWLTEFETINNVSLKIKTKKKQTAGYLITGAITIREGGVHLKNLSGN